MRTPTLLLVPALCLLLPAPAAAEGRGHDRASGVGYITVTNGNDAPLQVLVDGDIVGTVRARCGDRFGPFAEGRHRVRVRYVGDGLQFPVLQEQVYVDARSPARLVAPELDAGIVTVANAWVQPMTLLLDGRFVASVPAETTATVRVHRARGTLALVTPGGATAAQEGVQLQGLRADRLELVPPRTGTVLVSNPSRMHAIDILCARGSTLARLAPGEARTLVQPAGRVTLQAAYRGVVFDRQVVLASPYDAHAFAAALPTHATLAVRNPNDDAVEIYADGLFLGSVVGRDRALLPEVPVGLAELTVVSRGRRGARAETVLVEVDPLAGALLTVPRLTVADGRGGTTGCPYSDTTYAAPRNGYGDDDDRDAYGYADVYEREDGHDEGRGRGDRGRAPGATGYASRR